MFTALTLDLETRSAVDIKACSYRRYAQHHTTGILCIGLQFLEEPEAVVELPRQVIFRPGDPCPQRVLYAIEHGIPVYAHNCPFDKRIWRAQCEILGWPDIPEELWRDTMAICSYYHLPRKLEKVALALELPVQKDMEGHRVMMTLSKPKKPTKPQLKKYAAAGIPEDRIPLMWVEDPKKLQINAEYCRKDVQVQTCLLKTLGHLPPERLRDWQLDQKINERGAPGDMNSLLNTLVIIEQEMARVQAEIQEVTTGITGEALVNSVNAREQILDYVRSHGIDMNALRKDDVANALAREDLGETVRRVLELRASAGKASIKKVKSMYDNIDVDGRLRDALVWHKASTGRWAGARWQPHNFPRDVLKAKEADEFHRVVATEVDPPGYYAERNGGSRDAFFDLISKAMRSYVKAPKGKRFLVSDFSAIESRVLAWLSGAITMLDAYHKKECVYSQFASRVYARTIVDKGPERQLGKVAVLGLGYGMGEVKFIETAAATKGVPDISVKTEVTGWDRRAGREVTKQITHGKVIVDLYRRTYPEIPRFWNDCEAAFIYAAQNQTRVQVRRVVFGCQGKWGYIVLPSGRCIWYYDPQVAQAKNPWNGRMEPKLSHMTVDERANFTRRSTWGGTLVENITQAVAADLLTAAIHRVENTGRYPVILSVHDEVISESEEGTLDEFHDLMKICPAWADGCPIDCESQEMHRYGK